ncbi:coiled-coil domain-containing protein [Falsiroseomonas oryzae]|uniref:hypothetical protein n=1 Tax=Falsiroseomonas oryzae TaxID=2766473 RepID=UPI0022EA7E88|nr:hypothetical protein [Roseomonas sp. MO-31]
MTTDLETAVNLAKGPGSSFGPDALVARLGVNRRIANELAREAQRAIALQMAGERLRAHEASGADRAAASLLDVVMTALGELTLKLQDLLQERHDETGRALADARLSGRREAEAEQAILVQRSQADAQTARDDAESAKARTLELEQELRQAQHERNEALARCERLGAELALRGSREDALQAELDACRAAGVSRDHAVLQELREHERLRGELSARTDQVAAAHEQIRVLQEALISIGSRQGHPSAATSKTQAGPLRRARKGGGAAPHSGTRTARTMGDGRPLDQPPSPQSC